MIILIYCLVGLGWPVALVTLAWALELRREVRRLREWQWASAVDDAVRIKESIQ